MQCHAPAKINLALHVTGRRPDGYHLLESLVVFTEFGDLLEAEDARQDSLSITGPQAARVPISGENLVVKARDMMRERFGAVTGTPVALHLDKQLPVAAGIGGGSANAAAALDLLCRFWKIDPDRQELNEIALALGADVPMCLAGQPLLARGIGEVLEPVQTLPRLAMLLVNPNLPLPTPQVFSALGRRDNEPLPELDFQNAPGGLARWLRASRNDLERPARELLPQINDVLDAIEKHGAHLARMSGSGATCFGLFDHIEAARQAGEAIVARHPEWFVRATVTLASKEAMADA
ncbi:4-(cytidine 5'-diphospho)-2-C-methyl-D-erythritol kinase [Nitratireductor luteus]|uniref:4-(cytidine 5'-diphospho)-2-C-methyl-D-erythritol kinase n=1 Tax=Nitratireductor luteus TaxID=2976980 RepID=UPI00223FAFA9|nr:4-(cytidine 5'-diphospho)-2-C-methyl-D-erythritol kinase [Nitratireductor luteus]